MEKGVKPFTTLHIPKGVTTITEHEFKALEMKAYDGSIDIDKLPAAEYRYFDRLRRLYYKYRHEDMPKEFAERMKAIAYTEYLHDKAERERVRCADIQYQYNIRLAQELKAEINKAPPDKKLIPALEVIGLLTGDDVFAKANIREIGGLL